MTRLLLVSEDPSSAAAPAALLRGEGYDARAVAFGDAVPELAEHGADLVLLDVARIERRGLELCRTMRGRRGVGIIVVSARAGEDDILLALEHGADDCVIRPLGTRELVARIRAVLRRRPGTAGNRLPAVIAAGPVALDPAARTATVTGERVELAGKEFRLLEAFVRNAGRTLPREQLLASVWDGVAGDSNTLNVHIKRLRDKIEPEPAAPRHLLTVRGVGYQFLPYPPDDRSARDVVTVLREALAWRLPPDGWLLLDGLTEHLDAALRDGDRERLGLLHQRIELLAPGAGDSSRVDSCPSALQHRIVALIARAERTERADGAVT
ncbi:CATRA system-associated protein [Dactylosporangium sp. NPDC000244]|uniref:CATRA system-associated protein n=1 Tax=Dactylosporangium sp. NPDC000244 TaxID=3154365 RepID=UPI0033202FCD